ncbi:MAG: insulinase family protein [Elusimicrobia bacterium]|nr:insulinase family protein [Elusimicrobiota bacterium]
MKKIFLSAVLTAVLSAFAGAQMKQDKISFLEKMGAVVEKDPKYPPVISYTLKNGMKFLILEKKFVPTVSFTMMFKVGNVDNLQGKSGLAHLFEHMAFKGTKTINTSNYEAEKKILDKIEETALLLNEEDKKSARDEAKIKKLKDELSSLEKEAEKYAVREELWKIYNKLGEHGLNAFTSTDYTGYVIELPSNRLEAWMTIESDRFQNPVLRDFYKERSVVLEELRMNQADPNRVMWQTLLSNAFVAHPYRNPTIGWEDDVSHLTRTDAENFYKKFYVPNNCTVAVVGDVDAEKTIKLAEKYFSSWQSKPLPNTDYTKEPAQNSEKTIKLFYKAKPMVKIGYKIPAGDHKDIPALIVLSEILSSGKTSRFYKEIVENKKMALYANSYVGFPGDRYPSLFITQGAPKEGFTNEDLDKSLTEEIEKIKNIPPTQWELQKVINNYEVSLITQLESNAGFSNALASNDRILGDWKLQWKQLEDIKKLKPEDISAAAAKYLKAENKTAVYLIETK